MKRAGLFALVAMLCLAQVSRDAYRTAYRILRETDPDLEHDAEAGGAPLAQRADRMAAEAAKWVAARQAFFQGAAADESQQIAWLETPGSSERAPAASQFATQFLASENGSLTRAIGGFAKNTDPGIRKLRFAMVRERTALRALLASFAEPTGLEETATAPADAIEASRAKALEQSRALLTGFKDAEADAGREGAAWAEYYRKLGEGAQGTATPITQVPPGVTAVEVNNPVVAPPTVTPVPLERYIGAWMYPQTNGLYHGSQPESVDLVVHDDHNHASGTLSARFKLPDGSTGDPVLRFDFSGDFQPTRNQVFNLVTSDGTKGTLELIPGPAFNLLEVNFQTAPKPGKIRQADMILLKK